MLLPRNMHGHSHAAACFCLWIITRTQLSDPFDTLPRRFEDFGLDMNLTNKLRELYKGDLESVEFFVGLTIEAPPVQNTFLPEVSLVQHLSYKPGYWGSRLKLQLGFNSYLVLATQTMLTAVTMFAISAIMNVNMIKNPALWSTQLLTPAGKAFIQSTNLSAFLELGSDVVAPFYLPNRQPNYQHTVPKPTTW